MHLLATLAVAGHMGNPARPMIDFRLESFEVGPRRLVVHPEQRKWLRENGMFAPMGIARIQQQDIANETTYSDFMDQLLFSAFARQPNPGLDARPRSSTRSFGLLRVRSMRS